MHWRLASEFGFSRWRARIATLFWLMGRSVTQIPPGEGSACPSIKPFSRHR